MATTLQLPPDVETWTAERVVAYALEQFPGRVALACSFQKEETVLLDMLFAADPLARYETPFPRLPSDCQVAPGWNAAGRNNSGGSNTTSRFSAGRYIESW